MRLKLISCEMLYREMCAAVARAPHRVEVEFLSKGLHDLSGAPMCGKLQECVDRVDPREFDAVLMGYALCGTGLAGLCARSRPLVIPRAHDCIALLMGSRHTYREYFDANPGVYYRSTGWLERGSGVEQVFADGSGMGRTLGELIARYGDDNGRYLWEEFTKYKTRYNQLAFIETGLEPDGSFEQRARAEAEEKGWRFSKLTGSLTLFERLVSGDWPDADFLVVQPGWRIAPQYDDTVMRAEEIPHDQP